jgi:replicative DNA helicase
MRPGLSTGWPSVDTALGGGLFPGHLIIIASRTSVGKSAMAINLASNVAVDGGVAFFYSLEMHVNELALRQRSALSGVPQSQFDTGSYSESDRSAWDEAAAAVGGRLLLSNSTKSTVSEVREHARELQRTEGLSLIVVDNLGLMKEPSSKEGRTAELSAIARELKLLAKTLDVPVVLLAHLGSETNLSGMAWTSPEFGIAIQCEAYADVVVVLDRLIEPEGLAPADDTLGVRIAKNRYGPLAALRLNYNLPTQKITERP